MHIVAEPVRSYLTESITLNNLVLYSWIIRFDSMDRITLRCKYKSFIVFIQVMRCLIASGYALILTQNYLLLCYILEIS